MPSWIRLFCPEAPNARSCALWSTPQRTDETTTQDGLLSHSLNLRSVYDHVTKNGEREVTTYLRNQPVAVDYIFYSIEDKQIEKSTSTDGADAQSPSASWTTTNVREDRLRCLERYRLPGSSHLSRTIGYLPNQYCASDHLPLMAKFALDR